MKVLKVIPTIERSNWSLGKEAFDIKKIRDIAKMVVRRLVDIYKQESIPSRRETISYKYDKRNS